MKKNQLTIVLFLGLTASAFSNHEAPAPAVQEHEVKIHFKGLVTHVPEGEPTQDGTLTILMGDYSSPAALPVKGAMLGGNFVPLAAHQARLYFRARGVKSSSWTVKKAIADKNCKPPAGATHFIDLDRDDISIVNPTAPKFKVPERDWAEQPNGVKEPNYGWVPSLSEIVKQKINPEFKKQPCQKCDLLEARLTTQHGTLETERLWKPGPNAYKLYEFAGTMLKKRAVSRGSVLLVKVSDSLELESKPMDGSPERSLVLEHPAEIWLTNDPIEGPPDCKGGFVDFVGHYNLVADPDAVSNNAPYPVEAASFGLPQHDGQCSPVDGDW